MRILHVLPHRGGGAEVYIDTLGRLAGFEHVRYPLSAGRSPASGLVSVPGRWPGLALQARSADLIHVHGDIAAVLAFPLLGSRPAVMTTHGLHMSRRVSGPAAVAMHRALATSVAALRAVICTSDSELADMTRIAGPRRAAKLVLIPNGVDEPAALAPAARAELRRELGAGPEDVLVLFVGQLEPRKGPLLAARAATRVRAAGVPLILALAGDGQLRAELEALRGPAVRPLGYRADADRLLAAADVFLAPAEREGMSLALLGAMSHGLAVAAADGPGNPEALGDAGLLFGAGDEDGLVAALERLASDAELRARLGERAAARVTERFSVGRFLAETEAVYRGAVGVTAPGPGAPGPPA